MTEDATVTEKTLVGMIGLPYSGKSTKARALGFPIVCPDAIRLALHGQRFAPEAENMVWTLAEIMVNALFSAGHDVVVLDSCNQTEERRKRWERPDQWHTTWMVCRTPVEECRIRAREAGDEEILPIIERMAHTWTVPESWTPA